MSVLIDGIMLPKNENIYITLMPGGAVVTTEKRQYYSHPKVKEIPAHHGRLIDADAIPYKKIMYDEETDEFYYGVTKPYIDRMPTIIEAEE